MMMMRALRPQRMVTAVRGPSTRYFSALTNQVDSMIKDNPLLMISKSTCPSCKRAKDTLRSAKVKNAIVVDIDTEVSNQEVEEIQVHMKKLTGARTVPRIFIGGKCIGGNDDLQGLKNQGKLNDHLLQAGVM